MRDRVSKTYYLMNQASYVWKGFLEAFLMDAHEMVVTLSKV